LRVLEDRRNMAGVHSHGGDVGGAEAAIAKLQEMCAGEVAEAKSSALKALCAGTDLQLHASAGKERIALYGAWLASVSGSSLVVCGTADEAAAIKGMLSECKVEATVAASTDEVKGALAAGGVVIGQVACVAGAFKGAGKPQVGRCVVDAVDSIVAELTLSDLESFLLSFRDANPEAQLVLISSEPSLNMSALSRRFHNDAKTCSIKGQNIESMEHLYYEVGTTLLAKPQVLCDLIELEGGASCIVFCNSPSDADFADVILKKRGLTSVKLIGYVPQIKLSKAIVQLQKKEVSVLVLTDVAARGVPLEDFDLVVNYSIPTDPEVYFHRYGSGAESKTKKVISLVAPMDMSNFHYLKKLGKLEFNQGELPSPEQLFVGKFAQLRSQAVEQGVLNDPTIVALVDKVLADEKSKEIIGLLLYNTMTVLPSMKTARASAQDDGGDDYESQEEEGSGDRRGGDRRGGDRRGGDRRGGGQGEGRGDNRNRRPQQHASDEFEDQRGQPEDDDQQPRRGRRRDQDGEGRGEGRGERGDRGDRGERGDRGPRQQRKPMAVDKEARLYVGAGSKQGLSKESLTNDLVNTCGLEAADVHRVSVRGLYSFVDVPEAAAAKVLEKLPDVSVRDSGKSYFVKKAVTLSIPREGGASEGDEGFQGEGFQHEGSHHEHQSEMPSHGVEESEGPTLLAVDDV